MPAWTSTASAPPLATLSIVSLMSASPSIGPTDTPWSIGIIFFSPSCRNFRLNLFFFPFSFFLKSFDHFLGEEKFGVEEEPPTPAANEIVAESHVLDTVQCW